MASTVALHFLSVLLLLLMNGHDTRARDIKVELHDETQLEWDKATPVSHDESGEGYTSESTKSDYVPSYSTKQHNHHHEKLHHHSKTSDDIHKSDQPNYIAGHKTKAYESNAPYIASYATHKISSPSDVHKPKNPYSGYAASYGIKTQDSNIPYETGYKITSKSKNPYSGYAASYGIKIQDSNIPYEAGYKTTSKSKNPYSSYAASYGFKTHDSNIPYEAGYKTTSKSKNPYSGYAASYGIKTQDSNAPYIASYKTTSKSKNPYSGYAASYSIKTEDSNAPYIASYQTTSKSKNPYSGYAASYGIKTQDSSPSYISDAREITPPKESSNIDHTETFKKGFFALDDLYVGNEMTLQFPIQEVSSFLPKEDVELIPFSISQLPSVLQLFSIPEDSPKANAMRNTLEQCESTPITGETKICATSLESMLEFVSTITGSEAKHNILTTSYPTTSGVSLQKYTILEVSEDINAPKWVACHPLPYPYAIYYCHFIATGTKVFKVSLGAENGDKMEALGICHLDTSDWDPNNFVFRQLGITPGKDPVCHFFPINHLMWVPQPSHATM